MNHVEYLAVHFHWTGDLMNSGGSVRYIQGVTVSDVRIACSELD